MGKVLLAEDDEIVGELVVDAFIEAGHAIGWLKDGKAALDVVERRRPDLLILDCNMPEMSGIELLRTIRTSETLFDLPVMMLTGRQGDTDEQILRYEGANDYLRKPFDPMVLVGRAEELMKGMRRWD